MPVNLASVAHDNRLKVERELLAQAVHRLAEVKAQLDRDGVVVVGSQGQPRPNPLIALEQRLRAEVNDRRRRVTDAKDRA